MQSTTRHIHLSIPAVAFPFLCVSFTSSGEDATMARPHEYDPVQLAFEKSIRDFKANLKDDRLYSEILQTSTIDQVYDFTEKLQADQAKDGHMRHLSKIGPFLERLRGYADAIETYVQVKPDILALIWGPIKLLLQWTSTLKQSLDELIKTIAVVGNLLPEFKEVVGLFGHNKQINEVLALFFQDILDIYVVALKFFSASRKFYWSTARAKRSLAVTIV
jgi:hypothetical protein